MTPFTESQKRMVFADHEMYLYWIMYVQTTISSCISSILSMAANFYILTLINFVSMEFKILAVSFKRLLNDIDDDIDEQKAIKIVEKLKDYIKYYQRLL